MKTKDVIYDLIIIGAGAAGLFAGASLAMPVNGLVLEKTLRPGSKLLMSGSGQCNLTHGGDIKEFIPHYGENGNRIRTVLYRFNNRAVMGFFEDHGLPLFEREDGKLFPRSLSARDVLSVLTRCCVENGLRFVYSSPVTAIGFDGLFYTVHCGEDSFRAKKIIVATGGCSYPTTGSDGRFFTVLEKMGIQVVPQKPALVPIHVEAYPFSALSGISFKEASVTIACPGNIRHTTGDLLLTHNGFSGPAVLNASRYASPGCELKINYVTRKPRDFLKKEFTQAVRGNRKQVSTLLHEILGGQVPKRFLDLICERADLDPSRISSTVSGTGTELILDLLTQDRFRISGTGGYRMAMTSRGGVSLDEIHIKSLESRKYQGIYFAGEVLDVDGDTGGYNLQFAFSSAYTAARNIIP